MAWALVRTNRDYRLLLSASSVSNLGDGILAVALPWLATLLSGNAMLVAAVATAQRLPWFLFSLPAGVWTDRVDRRLLMVRADMVRVALMAVTVAMVLSQPAVPGAGPILVLVLVAFLIGSAEVVRDNAAQTLLPSIVAPDDLERANGQMWSAEQVAGQFAGPPLAGLLIGAGVALPFGLDATICALAAGLVWMIVLPPRAPGRHAGFWPALREGLVWMRRNPAILRLAIMLGVINAVFTGGTTILVLYAQEVLGLSAAGFGVLLTFGALGGVAGGLLAPRVAARLGMRTSLLVALAVFVGLNLLLGLGRSPALAAAALFLEAASGMLWNVVTVSFRQRLIPDALLGRVNSVYRFFGWGAMPFGAMGAGALVTALAPAIGREAALHAPYLVAAAVCAGLTVYAVLRLRFD